MKATIFLLYFGLSLMVSCTQAPSALVPEQAENVNPCQLQSVALVELKEAGHDGADPFWHLVLLDEEGKRMEDVHPNRLPNSWREVGKKVEIIYYFSKMGDFEYISACGAGGEGEKTIETMREIVLCEMSGEGS